MKALDHDTIERENLIELYALGRLDEERSAAFEDHFVDCPRCLEQVELVQDMAPALRSTLGDEAARSGVPADGGGRAVDPTGEAAPGSVLPFERPAAETPRATRRPGLPWPAVAAIALLALLPSWWLSRQNQALNERLGLLRAPRVVSPMAALETTRDSESNVIPLSPSSEEAWLTVTVDVGEIPEDVDVVAVLADADDRELWRSEPLTPPLQHGYWLSFPADLLPDGRYTLTVELVSGDRKEIAGRFTLRVKRSI